MAIQYDQRNLGLQVQLVCIRQKQAEIDKMFDESVNNSGKIKIFPVSVILQACVAAASMMGAGAAIMKLFFL